MCVGETPKLVLPGRVFCPGVHFTLADVHLGCSDMLNLPCDHIMSYFG